jgi:large subunit ribosomal protein L25
MASSDTTQLAITPRDLEGSRATRRLRRSGRVPGILYGGDGEPVPFSADQRELRIALNSSGAVVSCRSRARRRRRCSRSSSAIPSAAR